MSSITFARTASLGFEESNGLWESSFGHEDSILGSLGNPADTMDDGLANDLFAMEMGVGLDQPLTLSCGGEQPSWGSLEDEHKGALLSMASFPGAEDTTDHGEEEDKAEEAPRTPSPKPVRNVLQNNVHEITPESYSQPKFQLPDTTELELQYQRTLKRLSKSMRRTDETRGIVKRQRLNKTDPNCNFFQSSKAKVMEESRKKLYRMIVTGF